MQLKNADLNQIIIKKTITVSSNATLLDAREKLLRHKLKRLVVLDSKKRPVGIITEKDVGLFLFDESTKQGLDLIPLENIMKKIVFVDGSESVENCAKKMMEHHAAQAQAPALRERHNNFSHFQL